MGQLDDILAAVLRVEEMIKARPAASVQRAVSSGEVADDADLGGKYGNEPIRKDPPKWIKDGGASYAGRRPSECPADYLDALAAFHDWRAGKDVESGKDPKWARTDAARCRGWAARIRGGKTQTVGGVEFGPSTSAPPDDDSIPF